MAGAKNHDYHILDPDIWPFVGSMSALTFTTGMVMFMHADEGAFPEGLWRIVLGLGIAMAGYDLFRTFFRGQDRNGD